MEMDVCAGRHCVLVACFFRRHADSSKFRSSRQASALLIPFRHFTLHSYTDLLCLSSSFEEDTSQIGAGTRMIKVKFVLRRRCEFGQQFFVIGDDKLLGGWAPEAAIPMQWSEGHVWTLQLGLSSGTRVEFKILLKADEEVIEWQPGPNRLIEVSDSVTSLLVTVPWSGGESLEFGTLQSLKMSDAQRTHVMVETASPVRILSDAVDFAENVDSESDAAVSLDVADEPKTNERSANCATDISNAEEFVDRRKEVARGLITGDGALIDKPSDDFLTSYPIPESWYVKESSDIQASHYITDPSPGLLEVHATGRSLTSGPELSVNEEDNAGEKAFLSNESNVLIAKTTNSESDIEHIYAKEREKQHRDEDKAADRIAPRNVGTVLSTAEPKHTQKGSDEKAISEYGRTGAVDAEPHEEFIVDPAVLDNEESTADEHKDPMDVSAESGVKATVATPAKNQLPGSELQSESVESKCAQEKRWGWSKLWDAIVQGRLAS